MKALVLTLIKGALQIEERPELQPGEDQIVARIRAAALNRRDYWITQGMYPGIRTPVILGSDGAGVVTSIGGGVQRDWIGKEVIINPALEWGDSQSAQSSNFRILGMPDDGTFATEIVVPACQLFPKPDHLSWQEAAALPLAGLTAYRVLFSQGQLKQGERVLISGIGGGVATFALQFAIAARAKVLVTSSSAEKIARAVNMGAEAGFDYTAEGWAKELQSKHGQVDLIVDSAGGEGYASLIELAAPGGRIVNYGATAGPPARFELSKLFWKQLHVIGSTMGSPSDFEAMLAMIDHHQIKPVIDNVYPLDEGNRALQRMKNSQQFGKLALSVS